MRLRTSLKTRIHAVLADRGVRVEESLWTKAGRDRLAALDLPRRVLWPELAVFANNPWKVD